MSRTLSAAALRGMLAQETAEVYLECVTITHPDLASTIRIVNDKVDVVRTAGTFTAFPFQMKLPDDDDQQIPQVTLTADGVDQTIALAIQGLDFPMPVISYEVVLKSSPNTVEVGPIELDAIVVTTDMYSVQATLGYEEDYLNEPFPGEICTPSNDPGLFA